VLLTTNEYCGSCDNRCGTDEICVQQIPGVPTSSVCRPKPTNITCPNAGDVYCPNAGCVNVLTNPYYCGNCNTSCSPGEYCNNGTCVLNVVQPTTAFENVKPLATFQIEKILQNPNSIYTSSDKDQFITLLKTDFSTNIAEQTNCYLNFLITQRGKTEYEIAKMTFSEIVNEIDPYFDQFASTCPSDRQLSFICHFLTVKSTCKPDTQTLFNFIKNNIIYGSMGSLYTNFNQFNLTMDEATSYNTFLNSNCATPTPTCAGGETICNNTTCVDLNKDSNNCGRCGNQCQYGYICSSGSCVPDITNITIENEKAKILITDSGLLGQPGIINVLINSASLTNTDLYRLDIYTYERDTSIPPVRVNYNNTITLTRVKDNTNIYYFKLPDGTMLPEKTVYTRIYIMPTNGSTNAVFYDNDVQTICQDPANTLCYETGNCTNLSTDKFNCGKCGKPCFDFNAYCSNGLCQTPVDPKQ
jgi:hypothetical protein